MLLGYTIGMIRILDLLPNQQQYPHWLRLIPKPIIVTIAIAFIYIFVGRLPLIAKNIITAHHAKNVCLVEIISAPFHDLSSAKLNYGH